MDSELVSQHGVLWPSVLAIQVFPGWGGREVECRANTTPVLSPGGGYLSFVFDAGVLFTMYAPLPLGQKLRGELC